jgi:PS-10 peptidase S37
MLTERDALVPLVSGTFGRIPVDQAFELAVIELPFAFWQYGDPDDPDTGCAAVPAAGATPQQQLDFLETHSSPAVLAGAAFLDTFEPYYFQAATELGAPEPYEAPVRDLLRYPGTDVPSTFVSPGRPLPFNAAAMPDVNAWLATRGQRMLFVYGSLDPWSARPFQLGLADDSFTFVVDQGNHGASLSKLGATSQQAFDVVSRWLGATLVPAPKAARREEEPERRAPR